MSKKLISDSILTAIANAIRTKRGTSVQYKPSEMANAILSIPTGGGGGVTPSGQLSITENNRVYDVYQYAEASVQIPNPTGVLEIDENGTYGVLGYGSVEVDVPQRQQPTGTLFVVRNGNYDVSNYANLTVNVDQAPATNPYVLQKKDYLFIDQYGLPKYGFSAEELLALSALPSGYTWNYTLADLTALANAGCPAVVGTGGTSSECELYFSGVELTSSQRIVVVVTLNNFSGIIGYNEIIPDDPTVLPPVADSDWYDGYSGEVEIAITVGGSYDQTISISGVDGLFALGRAGGYSIFKEGETLGESLLKTLRVSSYCSEIYPRSFQNCMGLESVLLPSESLVGGLIIGSWAFNGCKRLKGITIPNSLNLTEMAENDDTPFSLDSIDYISFAPTMTNLDEIVRSGSLPIRKTSIPIGVTRLSGNMFEILANQPKLVLPPSITEISTPYAFGLNELVIKNTSAVVNLVSDPYYALQNVLIKVPSSLLSTYKNSTNWSFYASNIVADV